ncbi:TPA: hypothetical protein MIM84_26350 [Klebsiella pneumoniae]|nr:hypothetical protein [Klebsiella pneumoniae]
MWILYGMWEGPTQQFLMVANRDQSGRAQRRLWRFKRVWLCREGGGIGRTCQNSSRLRQATAPFALGTPFNYCWRLHAADAALSIL